MYIYLDIKLKQKINNEELHVENIKRIILYFLILIPLEMNEILFSLFMLKK